MSEFDLVILVVSMWALVICHILVKGLNAILAQLQRIEQAQERKPRQVDRESWS